MEIFAEACGCVCVCVCVCDRQCRVCVCWFDFLGVINYKQAFLTALAFTG